MPLPTETKGKDNPGSTSGQDSTDLCADLVAASDIVKGLGKGYERNANRILELRDRLEKGVFHLAVLGQFKRGKSTFLNSLLGEAVLPTSVVPLTSLPTFIRSGPSRGLTVHLNDGSGIIKEGIEDDSKFNDILSGYVTETGNPKNRLGVTRVDVFHPSDILRSGVVLIDTPGIGSTLHHNTEQTLNFLPQCDAALFIVSADPPITEVELGFLKDVSAKVPRLFFIFNKMDYLTASDRRTALDFLRRTLTEHIELPESARIFCVSALQGLQARRNDDSELFASSGMAELERYIVDFLANEKNEALRAAVIKKAVDELNEVMMIVRLAIRSYQMPMEDLEKRLEQFEAKIEEARRQKIVTNDILEGDRKRVHEALEERSEELRAKARAYLWGIIEEEFKGKGEFSEEGILVSISEAIPPFFERESGQTTDRFRKLMEGTLGPHQERVNSLLGSVRSAASEVFDIPFDPVKGKETFELVHEPQWVTRKWFAKVIPVPTSLIDRVLPSSVRERRIRKDLRTQMEQIMVHNVENLRWAIFQSINETFLRFGSLINERLEQTIEGIQGAIFAALERRRNFSEAASRDLKKLEQALIDLERVRTSLLHPLAEDSCSKGPYAHLKAPVRR